MSTATLAATILVVEDEAAVRELLAMALEAHSYEAILAANCAEAIDCLNAGHVDLMLLDLKLGDESGVDLLKTIRKMPGCETLPVILLTGCEIRSVVLEMAHLGIDSYLIKRQFSRKDLAARIDRILKAQKQNALAPAPEVPKPSRKSSVAPAQTSAEPDKDTSRADLLRSLKPITTRSQIIEMVDRCIELKARLPVLPKLMSVTSDPKCSLEEIAQVVQMDQAMAMKVLKIANSTEYGSTRVDTVSKALFRIGLTQVQQLLFSMSVIENFHASSLGEHFNPEFFWEHSIATGLIASAIAEARGGDKNEIDFAYTMGLLHDATRMVLAEQLDDVYRRVLDTAAQLQLPLDQVESRMLMVNHAEIADRLLSVWKFPRRLIEAVSGHHRAVSEISYLSPRNISDVGTLVLADRLAHAMLLGSSGNNSQSPIEDLVNVLALKPLTIQKIEHEIGDKVGDIKYSMFMPTGEAPAADFHQRMLKKIRRPLRPLFLSANPQIDAYRILLDRLTVTSSQAPANIAILHLAKPVDSHLLFNTLRDQEKAMNIDPLPLIIISPLASPPLDKKALMGREYKKLPSPFVLTWLIDAANSLLSRAD